MHSSYSVISQYLAVLVGLFLYSVCIKNFESFTSTGLGIHFVYGLILFVAMVATIIANPFNYGTIVVATLISVVWYVWCIAEINAFVNGVYSMFVFKRNNYFLAALSITTAL